MFRYKLRTLMIVVTAICPGLALVAQAGVVGALFVSWPIPVLLWDSLWEWRERRAQG
jgi:hypothetical protein